MRFVKNKVWHGMFVWFFAACIYYPSHAEYLFICKNRANITQREHDAIYEVLTRYTFPANTNPCLQHDELTPEEKEHMYQKELEFLHTKLPSGVTPVYVPTTLYELLVLHLWLNIKLHTDSWYQDSLVKTSLFGFPHNAQLWSKKENFLTTGFVSNPVRETWLAMFELWGNKFINIPESEHHSYALYRDINNIQELRTLHALINHEIIKYLESNGYNPEALTLEDIARVTTNLVTHLTATNRNLRYAYTGSEPEYYLCAEGITDNDLILACIKEELKAFNQGNFLLYRGTHGWEGRKGKIDSTLTHRDGATHPNSISYGSTLFAALFGNDTLVGGGAMAYSYMVRSDLSYAVIINKQDYACGDTQNLFFIPPITTLVGLLSHSELFHSRSKASFTTPDDHLCGILGLNNICFKVPSFLYVLNPDRLEHERHFSEYLAHNSVILKNTSSTPTDVFLHNQVQPVTLHDYAEIDSGFSDLAWKLFIQ